MKKEDKFQKVFKIFKNNYIEVPLETFGKDPYNTLISTILSSRTKDELTLEICKRLFQKAPNIKSLNKLNQLEISNLIYPVGFYRTKAKHLKKLSKIILIKYNGKIPNSRDELMKLPGVGRKTANLVLSRTFGEPAIAVDTHVHKISNLLGWVHTKTPEETEKELVKILPKKYWSEINHLFVSIGRQFRSKEGLKEFLRSNRLL
jgi:endonuclease-3